jgi:hypothetical protein
VTIDQNTTSKQEEDTMLTLVKGVHHFQDNLFTSQQELFERLSK